MKAQEFKEYWKETYPNALPINDELKWIYRERWFRIHSLPESKRYADTEEEYTIILNRQNQLMEELIGEGIELVVAFGLFTNDITNENYKKNFNFREFRQVWTIDLHKKRPDEYVPELYLDIFVKIENWQKTKEIIF